MEITIHVDVHKCYLSHLVISMNSILVFNYYMYIDYISNNFWLLSATQVQFESASVVHTGVQCNMVNLPPLSFKWETADTDLREFNDDGPTTTI